MIEYVCGYPNREDNSQIFEPLKYGSEMSVLDKSLNSYFPKLVSPSRIAIISLFFNSLYKSFTKYFHHPIYLVVLVIL